jgi:hypothetical protein
MEKQNKPETQQWRPDPFHSNNILKPHETSSRDPMEFLSRSWSASAMEVSKALSPAQIPSSNAAILEDLAGEIDESNVTFSGNPFSFASSQTSQMVLDRIMSHSVCSSNYYSTIKFLVFHCFYNIFFIHLVLFVFI